MPTMRDQFPRLLAEIRACGLTKAQYAQLKDSMDCPKEFIEEILFAAEVDFELEKNKVYGRKETRQQVIERLKSYEENTEPKKRK